MTGSDVAVVPDRVPGCSRLPRGGYGLLLVFAGARFLHQQGIEPPPHGVVLIKRTMSEFSMKLSSAIRAIVLTGVVASVGCNQERPVSPSAPSMFIPHLSGGWSGPMTVTA